MIVFHGTVYDCDHDSRVSAAEIPCIGGTHIRSGPEIRAQTAVIVQVPLGSEIRVGHKAGLSASGQRLESLDCPGRADRGVSVWLNQFHAGRLDQDVSRLGQVAFRREVDNEPSVQAEFCSKFRVFRLCRQSRTQGRYFHFASDYIRHGGAVALLPERGGLFREHQEHFPSDFGFFLEITFVSAFFTRRKEQSRE